MQINLSTIEEHAGEKLRRISGEPVERVAALRQFLKVETARLRLRHRYGVGGAQIAAARALIIDLLVRRIAEGVTGSGGKGVAVIALGGYGRRELSPCSDIDLLFLHQGRREAEQARALSESVLYQLWDSGLTVGHSVRSLSECLSIAREDLSSLTALIDARLLWGGEWLFQTLTRRLDEDVFRSRRRAMLDRIVEEQEQRYERFGRVVCLQEPNVKETAGGLRDLHTLCWAARVAWGTIGLEALLEARQISERDAKAAGASYDYLLRVRHELHFLTNRRTDLLSLDYQGQVARHLRYAQTPELQASEVFMRDYYRHAQRLHRVCAAHVRRAVQAPVKGRWFGRGRQTEATGGFIMRDGELDLAPGSASLDVERLLLAFTYSQATGAPFGAALEDALTSQLRLVDRRFRTSPEAASAFLKMLRARGRVAAALRSMHECGFLGKYLPEFGRITCLVQHDLYHRYTIDEHTLRAIETLDELSNSRSRSLERYRGIYHEVADPAILHLGLLLHDIGKGLGGGHAEKGIAIAARVSARLSLAPEAAADVAFLIREHLTMSHISQRRDLADEKVIAGFAARVGTLDRLNMLTLLTYGDTNGVGPGVWNEWKDALLWELYHKTRAQLVPAEAEASEVEPLRQRIAQMLSSEIDYEAVREHFAQLPEDYARQTPPQTIIEHLRLAHALKSRAVRTSWRVNAQARCTDLHLAARNRRGLFAALAGTLTAQGVNILSAHLNTRADGIAIDSFKVRDTAGEPITDPARWEQIEDELRRALGGEVDVEAGVARRLRGSGSRLTRRRAVPTPSTRLAWDNHSSDRSTILEVRAADRLGLAYRIASTLAALDLDIGFAKVATEKNLALDIFYITKADGEKLAADDLASVEESIRRALGTHFKEGAD